MSLKFFRNEVKISIAALSVENIELKAKLLDVI